MVSAVRLGEPALSLYVYSYPLEPASRLPILPIYVITEHKAELPVLYSRFPPAVYFTHGSVYMSILPFQFVPPSSPLLPWFKFLTDFLWLLNTPLGIIVVIDVCVHFVRLGSARHSSPLTTKSRKAWPYDISVYNRVGSQKRRHCFYLIKISARVLGRCLYWFRV